MSTYSSLVLASSPRAYYRLGETSGSTAYDLSGNGYHGTLHGGITPMQQNAIITDYTDYAMAFAGASSLSYITLPAALTTNGLAALTVECWLYLAVTPAGYMMPIGNDIAPQTNHVGFDITISPQGDGNTGYFVVGNGTTGVLKGFGTNALSTLTWHHLVGVYNGANVLVYLDGVPDQKTNPALTGTVGTATHSVNIGASANIPPNGDYFVGAIDEVAIYPSALSAATILNHYNTGNFGRSGIAWFPPAIRRQS